jgi:hypothetical protein
MNQIKFPSINSKIEKEKEMAEVALELKIKYSEGELSELEIKHSESIPNWSWELTSEEKLYMINKIKNFVEANNEIKGGKT